MEGLGLHGALLDSFDELALHVRFEEVRKLAMVADERGLGTGSGGRDAAVHGVEDLQQESLGVVVEARLGNGWRLRQPVDERVPVRTSFGEPGWDLLKLHLGTAFEEGPLLGGEHCVEAAQRFACLEGAVIGERVVVHPDATRGLETHRSMHLDSCNRLVRPS